MRVHPEVMKATTTSAVSTGPIADVRWLSRMVIGATPRRLRVLIVPSWW